MKLTGILNSLENYPIKGSFRLAPEDVLSKVCDIPIRKDYSGLYLFYDSNHKLIYVGISGREGADGNIIHRKDGLRGRFLTGKQFGDRRSKTLPIQMKNENIRFLEIRWFVTFGGDSYDIPRKIEEQILDAYKTENNGRRPKWNKRD